MPAARAPRRPKRARVPSEPKRPFKPQHQRRPGLESRMAPRPRYRAPVVFFASAVDSSYITGEVLTLLGGETTAG